MGWVTMSARLLYIQQELNSIEWQIDQIARQKMSLHKYASTISDGKITCMELAGMPIEHWGMALGYIYGGQMQANMSAFGNAAFALSQSFPGFAQQMSSIMQMDPNSQMSALRGLLFSSPIGILAYQKAQEEALNKAKQAEEARIKEIEEQLDFKMKKLEQRQKVLDKEYESVEKRVDKDIERTTPKYA